VPVILARRGFVRDVSILGLVSGSSSAAPYLGDYLFDFYDSAPAALHLASLHLEAVDLRIVVINPRVLERVEQGLYGIVHIAFAPVGRMQRDNNAQPTI